MRNAPRIWILLSAALASIAAVGGRASIDVGEGRRWQWRRRRSFWRSRPNRHRSDCGGRGRPTSGARLPPGRFRRRGGCCFLLPLSERSNTSTRRKERTRLRSLGEISSLSTIVGGDDDDDDGGEGEGEGEPVPRSKCFFSTAFDESDDRSSSTAKSNDGGFDRTRLAGSKRSKTTRHFCAEETFRDRTRRDALGSALRCASLASLATIATLAGLPLIPIASAATAAATVTTEHAPLDDGPFGVSDDVVSSLSYQRVLGDGTFKTVYLVSVPKKGGDRIGEGDDGEAGVVRYALAVERLRSKSDAKDAVRGVRIAERLRAAMTNEDDGDLFERIEGWWIQDVPLPEFVPGDAVFPRDLGSLGRTKKTPGKFLGTKWLVALKIAYDVDLKRFAQKAPALRPVGATAVTTTDGPPAVVSGVPLTGRSALGLAAGLCRAGRLMHAAGVVHRDVKPKNVMLRDGRPVVIDFGFAQFGDYGKDGRLCVSNPGKAKGEVRYVLAPDAAAFRGCAEGDAYAMGRTMYEVFFGAAKGREPSGRLPITEEAAAVENARFRAVLAASDAGDFSRFVLTEGERDVLLEAIRALCRKERPASFAEVEEEISVWIEPRPLDSARV